VSQKPRRSFSAEQRAAILKKHHLDKIPVSKICEEEDIQPSLFYYWQKVLFENAVAALQPSDAPRIKELEKENDALKARLAKKDEVIAEISEEYVAIKKARGGT
jgi:transposase-like protein